MRKLFSLITLTVLVWGCAKKITSAAGSTSSNSSSPAAASVLPSKLEVPAGGNTNTTPVAATPVASVPSTIAPASRNPAEVKPAPVEVLGQSTYNAKCGRCHGLKITTDYTADRWASIMQVMATKAQLTAVEKDNVLAYVRANAKK